jgi:hypothetical protein
VRLRLATILLFSAHLACALLILAYVFPHEDAVILFKFSRNVAAGQGIVFYPGGPHAEGATDFLWMLALAAAQKIGVDVAITAAVLNAFGIGMAGWLILRRLPAGLDVVAWLAVLLVPYAAASFLGFSATLYAALALGLFVTVADGDERWVPILAVLLGLFRPDGAILGAGLAVVGLVRARREARLKPYLASAAIALVLGAIYFVWRWRYFGNVLPLPMYVKQHKTGNPGIHQTLEWAALSLLPYGLAMIGLWRMGGSMRPYALASIPFAVHVASFMPTVQTQNIANRFQAPASLLLTFLAVEMARVAWGTASRARRIVLASCILVPAGVGAFDLSMTMRWNLEHDYLEPFAVKLGKIVPPGSAIATTEAGHLAYWSQAKILDVVGLNSPETAKTPPSRELLDRFSPDMIMMHPSGGFDWPRFQPHLSEDAITRMTVPLAPLLQDRCQPATKDPPARYEDLHMENILGGPVATMAWLDQRSDIYDVYVIKTLARGGIHVYAFKKTWPVKDQVLRTIRESYETRTSYLRSL